MAYDPKDYLVILRNTLELKALWMSCAAKGKLGGKSGRL